MALEDDSLECNEPIPLLQPVSYSPSSHSVRPVKLGFRRPRSQNVSEHRFGILPPTLGQIEEINRTHTSKEAKLEALRAAVNPQPLGVPSAVLQLRARLAPQAAPGPITGRRTVLVGEGPSVAQVFQGLSSLDLRNDNDARSLDVVVKSPQAETPQLGGNVGAFSAQADMNDSREDPNAADMVQYLENESATYGLLVCHRFARAEPVLKPSPEGSSTGLPTTGFNHPFNTAGTVPDGSVADSLDVLNHHFNSRSDGSCGEGCSLHVTRADVCAPHGESLPVPARQFQITGNYSCFLLLLPAHCS